ncbi:NAD(P)/FAD-dependent oxidoreductase [Bacillus sp. B19-2]|uniref:NAD(P)/FAD-dependent oxidoreductase n=1 Tax=Bacillus sp. B19-2 TaxID=2929516 RepID=UPI001FBA62BE|nr:NAD(P)/FAD-dependent oxidoreductase [Bacillus sp. B19-2]MCJ2147589.1 NAD(P)/FAD-dependent oxidoreductase [Bacillus sp. B19-2]
MIDLLVVGAGPAGLSAAIEAAEQGLYVLVIDEFPRVGGRLLGQLHQEPDGEWWNGISESDKLHKRAITAGIAIKCETSVYDIEKSKAGWRVHTSNGTLKSKALLLATGASEVPIPIPGWTLPGVISIGSAQVMGYVYRVKPGRSCVIIGANVLSMAIANELRLCGVDVKEILIPKPSLISQEAGQPISVLSSLMKLTHLAPNALLRQLGKAGRIFPPSLVAKCYPVKGIKMFGIPIKVKTAALEILGDKQVTGVRTTKITSSGAPIPETEKIVEADVVCIAGGLTPMAELASIAGCSFQYVPELGGHIPVHSEKMQTNIPGLYVAGNITGVESAKVAMAQGKVAGLTIAAEMSNRTSEIEDLINQAIHFVRKTRAEALIQFQPNIPKAREHMYKCYKTN